MSARRLLLMSRDPGATNQLIALDWFAEHTSEWATFPAFARVLFGEGRGELSVVRYAEAQNQSMWARQVDVFYDEDSAEKILTDNRITHLVTGLDDIDARSTRLFWESARNLGVPLIVLTDNDVNLSVRMVDTKGKPLIPDVILARNDKALAELPETTIVVENDLYKYYLSKQDQNYKNIRTSWGVGQNETVVLFASQNVSEMARIGRISPYSEFDELDKLISYMGQGILPDGTELISPRLVIRPHPRDDEGKYQSYLRTTSLSVCVDKSGTPQDAIYSSDVVAGMVSAFLEEAELVGKKVIHLLDYPIPGFGREE